MYRDSDIISLHVPLTPGCLQPLASASITQFTSTLLNLFIVPSLYLKYGRSARVAAEEAVLTTRRMA